MVRGADSPHRDNGGLRQAIWEQIQSVYLHDVAPGRYVAQWPAFVSRDDPARRAFTGTLDEVWSLEIAVP